MSCEHTLLKYWRVGALKVANEEDSNILGSKEVTMATMPQSTCQHNTENTKMCGKDTYQSVGGREGGGKEASKLKKESKTKAHGNAPADLPGPPLAIGETSVMA